MQISRSKAGTGLVVVALTLTVVAIVFPALLGAQNSATSQTRVIANTAFGPLTEADRDFVVKVRAAGLWEYPVGQLALKKGTTPAVKTAGQHLIDGHAGLDAACRTIAPQLGITLPNLASPQQRGFVAQLEGDTGKQFDSDMANILRVTHGQIFSTIAKIRANTRNTLVRQLADQANATVLDHITQMEKTGMVDFESVLVQETTKPTLPASDMTPPPPKQGDPAVILTPTGKPSSTPSPSITGEPTVK